MGLGGPGGSGPGEGGFGGGGAGDSGAGGGGGPANDPSMSMGRGGTGMSNPGQDYGALSDAFGAEINALNEKSLNTQAKVFRGVAMGLLGLLGTVVTGNIGVGLAVATMVGKFGLTPARAQALAESVARGQMSPEQASQRGASQVVFGNPDGGPADTEQGGKGKNGKGKNGKDEVTDPKDPSFWEQFVDEWQTTKENIRVNDEFKKTVLSPAFDTYQQRLAGLSQEKTFQPINIKMGDFETSFTTKRSAQNAGNILSSEIAEADVMAPKSAEMSYLDRLQGIATTEKGWQNQQDIAKITRKMPKDQGSTTDAITDWMGIIKGGSDLIDSIW